MALVVLVLSLGCDGQSDGARPVDATDQMEGQATIQAAESATYAGVGPLGEHGSNRYSASLETILDKRFLRVLTSRNAFDYFIYRGHRGGYQYEMVSAFTRFLNERYPLHASGLPIQFELIPVEDDQLIPLLLEGTADLIAARLTITPERSERIRFSRSYRTVDELVVTHDGTDEIDSVEDLSGRTVAVRESSSYHESLLELNRELERDDLAPVKVELVDGALETERILQLVAAGRYPYTVADSVVAELAAGIHPELRIVRNVSLRRGGKLAWATQLAAGALEAEINAFLVRYKERSLLGNLAVQKYFAIDRQLATRFASDGEENEGNEAALSEFDPLFKQHAASFGLDWRLAAAIAHQESRFDQTVRNRWGAIGLMQIKASTAAEPYVDVPDIEGPENASNNIKAGLKYLTWIKHRYFDSVPEMRERDRLRMALAAYNAGPRSVLRARRHALELGLDPDRWFRNVELAFLDLGKTEPVKYVSEINQRYVAYVLLGVE